MLKKAASGVLALLPCSRTESTLRASKGLRPFLRQGSGQGWTLRKDSGHAFLNIPSHCCEQAYLEHLWGMDLKYLTDPAYESGWGDKRLTFPGKVFPSQVFPLYHFNFLRGFVPADEIPSTNSGQAFCFGKRTQNHSRPCAALRVLSPPRPRREL